MIDAIDKMPKFLPFFSSLGLAILITCIVYAYITDLFIFLVLFVLCAIM